MTIIRGDAWAAVLGEQKPVKRAERVRPHSREAAADRGSQQLQVDRQAKPQHSPPPSDLPTALRIFHAQGPRLL